MRGTPSDAGPSAVANVHITAMRERHLAEVLAIERQVYPKPWSERLFRAELGQTPTRRYFVALGAGGRGAADAGQVLGYAGVMAGAGEAHVTNVAVDPQQHRRKIASRLMVALLRGATELGAEAATLEVRKANAGAAQLYQRFRFVPVGLRPGYYADTGEDAMIMWARGIDEPEYAAHLRSVEAQIDRLGGPDGGPQRHARRVNDRTSNPRPARGGRGTQATARGE